MFDVAWMLYAIQATLNKDLAFDLGFSFRLVIVVINPLGIEIEVKSIKPKLRVLILALEIVVTNGLSKLRLGFILGIG